MLDMVPARLNAARTMVLLVGVYFAIVGSRALSTVSWQYYFLEGGFYAGISFLTGGVALIVVIGLRFVKR